MNYIQSYYLRYAELGFSTVPIKTLAYAFPSPGRDKDAKTPLVKWAQYQTQRATPELIAWWAQSWPYAGIAVVCGELSDCLVLDDDRISLPSLRPGDRDEKAEKQYQILVEQYGGHDQLAVAYEASEQLYEALMQVTTARSRSSRGRHFYFRMPRDDDGHIRKVGNKVAFLPGWDLRAIGGYVIMPPSIHPSGTVYYWEEPPENGLADCPHWLYQSFERLPNVAMFNVKRSFGQEPAWELGTLVKPPRDFGKPVPDGQRDDTMTAFIGTHLGLPGPFWDELKWDEVRTLAHGFNARYNKPPLGEEQVDKVFFSIAARERAKRPGATRESFDQPFEFGNDTEMFTAQQLGLMDLHAPDYAVRGLFLDGLVLVIGKPKSGKSILMTQVTLAVALGLPLFRSTLAMYAFANHPQGFDTHQGDVLYIAYEDSKLRLQTRCAMITGSRALPANVTFATNWPLADRGGLQRIEQWLDGHPAARMVIVDPLSAFIAGKKPEGSLFREEFRMLRPEFELVHRRGHKPFAFVIVDHSGKGKGHFGSGDPFDAGIATLGANAAVDSILSLVNMKDGARLHYEGRDLEQGHFDMERLDGSPLWRLASQPLTEAQGKKSSASQNGKASASQESKSSASEG